MRRHPSRRALTKWLETGGPGRVDRHIAECDHCQEQLDRLSALDETTREVLVAATEPPSDLSERVRDGMDVRLRDEAAAGAFADLFAIGWDLLRCVVDPDPLEPGPHDRVDEADKERGGSR